MLLSEGLVSRLTTLMGIFQPAPLGSGPAQWQAQNQHVSVTSAILLDPTEYHLWGQP